MRWTKGVVVSFVLLSTLTVSAQTEKKQLREGNRYYENEEYVQAGEAYGKALEAKPDYYKGRFNQGNALYKIGDYDSAVATYKRAIALASESSERSSSFYNMGNTAMEMKQYEGAMAAYKETLKIDPANEDARYNLAYAQKMLQQQNQGGGADQEKEQQQEEEQQPEQQMNKDQMDQMLKALEQQEQEAQQKKQRAQVPVNPRKTEKDW